MKLPLDTHVLLWYIAGARQIPAVFQTAIQSSENSVFLSVASIWETMIKHKLGRLSLPGPPAEYLLQQRRLHQIASLAIDESTMPVLASLPAQHRDPFERILIARAVQHELVLVTVDAQMRAYPVSLLPTEQVTHTSARRSGRACWPGGRGRSRRTGPRPRRTTMR